MKDIDTAKISDIIRYVAAEEIMPRFRNLQQSDIHEKMPGDLVTVADEAAETLLTKLLQEALPGALVVGEEAVSKDASVLDRLKSDKPVWVIDPIDGTTNYTHGRLRFGVLIALMQGGVTRYGWAFDAPGNRMAVAQKGAGSFLDGERVSLMCTATDTKHLTGQGDGAPAASFDSARPFFREIVKSGCALYDYMQLLTGKADFIAYVDGITPWDHAAGNLLVQEAGGHVAMDASGTAYDPTQRRRAFMLAAQNPAWWTKIHAVLYPLFPLR